MSRPSLTSLLNSLHTHLQSQTQLLPTFHAQLGLPPTALEDDLAALHQRLVHSVEQQVDARRKEVENWVEKCRAIETECTNYAKLLGASAKAAGTTVGDLRSETILPKRYELVSEYQEKLRQLYHTKLEQLTTLTNRITTLSRTLGPDFYAYDIVESVLVTSDRPAFRDVTPERFLRLEKELVRGKGEVAKRLTQLSTTFLEIDWLHAELGIPPPTLDTSSPCSSPSPPSPTPDPFLSASTPTPSNRTKPPTPLLFRRALHEPSDTECHRIFTHFVARVDEAGDDDALRAGSAAVPIGLEHVDPTPGLLAWAATTRAGLEETKRRREAHIQAMYDELEGLWRRLGVPEADMDGFVEAHRGTTEGTMRAYEEELERMLELKRESMGEFVRSARVEIVSLWEDLMVGEEERADFAPFVDDEHTEELLTIHEEEIRRLKEERRLKAPLLAGIKKYFEICDEERELAAAASDQSRLLGRGPRDPGRLLREERMRKRVTKEKPRLEQDLLVSIPQWEAEAGRAFLVRGERIVRVLVKAAGAAEQENRRKTPHGGSVPPRATTPGSNGNSGSAKTGVVTPATRPGSAGAGARKRQRVGEASSGEERARVPLGVHRGQAASLTYASPVKVGSSSLPRPVAVSVGRGGVEFRGLYGVLGYGRAPGGVEAGAGREVRGTLSVSVSTGGVGAGRTASRARRESFRPRMSADGSEVGVGVGVGVGGRWGGFGGGAVREEDEGY